MAVAVEKSSKEFYEILSKKFPNFSYHFHSLDNDEERHVKIFSKILNYKIRDVNNMDNEYITILEGIFISLFGSLRDGPSRAKRISKIESSIEAAIQLEKDTLLLYLSMSKAFEKMGLLEIDKIIKEEQYHLQRVQNLNP